MKERKSWGSIETASGATGQKGRGIPQGARFPDPKDPGRSDYRFMARTPVSPGYASASSSVHVTIREQVQTPSGQGFIRTQTMQEIRTVHSNPTPHGNQCSSTVMIHEYSGQPNIAPQYRFPPERMDTVRRLDRKVVPLQVLGEIHADSDGNLYELQGPELRRLGRLVRDEGAGFSRYLPPIARANNPPTAWKPCPAPWDSLELCYRHRFRCLSR
jgi:hypothetical protein